MNCLEFPGDENAVGENGKWCSLSSPTRKVEFGVALKPLHRNPFTALSTGFRGGRRGGRGGGGFRPGTSLHSRTLAIKKLLFCLSSNVCNLKCRHNHH